jgi:hypothetical protein
MAVPIYDDNRCVVGYEGDGQRPCPDIDIRRVECPDGAFPKEILDENNCFLGTECAEDEFPCGRIACDEPRCTDDQILIVGEIDRKGCPVCPECGYDCRTKEMWSPEKREWCGGQGPVSPPCPPVVMCEPGFTVVEKFDEETQCVLSRCVREGAQCPEIYCPTVMCGRDEISVPTYNEEGCELCAECLPVDPNPMECPEVDCPALMCERGFIPQEAFDKYGCPMCDSCVEEELPPCPLIKCAAPDCGDLAVLDTFDQDSGCRKCPKCGYNCMDRSFSEAKQAWCSDEVNTMDLMPPPGKDRTGVTTEPQEPVESSAASLSAGLLFPAMVAAFCSM